MFQSDIGAFVIKIKCNVMNQLIASREEHADQSLWQIIELL